MDSSDKTTDAATTTPTVTTMEVAENNLVLMEDIEKRFPGVHAIDHGHFELRPGEVHALLGENGAGKSTLMKVLAGVYPKDGGRIFYRGREVEIPTPRAAQQL